MGCRAVSATFEGKFGSDEEEWRILELLLRGKERILERELMCMKIELRALLWRVGVDANWLSMD